MKLLFLSIITLFFLPHVWAAPLTVPKAFTANAPAVAADVNANFNAVKAAVDDNDSRISVNNTNMNANATNITANGSAITTNSNGITSNTAAISSGNTNNAPWKIIAAGGVVLGELMGIEPLTMAYIGISSTGYLFQANGATAKLGGYGKTIFYTTASCTGFTYTSGFYTNLYQVGMLNPSNRIVYGIDALQYNQSFTSFNEINPTVYAIPTGRAAIQPGITAGAPSILYGMINQTTAQLKVWDPITSKLIQATDALGVALQPSLNVAGYITQDALGNYEYLLAGVPTSTIAGLNAIYNINYDAAGFAIQTCQQTYPDLSGFPLATTDSGVFILVDINNAITTGIQSTPYSPPLTLSK